jgi:hypothetical protein
LQVQNKFINGLSKQHEKTPPVDNQRPMIIGKKIMIIRLKNDNS